MRIGVIVVGISLPIISIASADSFRCGSRVVSTGDSKADVIMKCGPPDYSEVTSVSYSDTEATKIETFYYNCGEGRFMRTLRFKGPTLTGIGSGGYGSGPQKCE